MSDAIAKHKESFPSKEDYDGAITALLRLQDTYQLQPSAFVQGKLPGSVPSPKMHLSEVYDVGRQAYLNSDMFYTKSWMDETLKLYHAGNELEDVNLFDIYDHLSFSEYKVIFYYEDSVFDSCHENVLVLQFQLLMYSVNVIILCSSRNIQPTPMEGTFALDPPPPLKFYSRGCLICFKKSFNVTFLITYPVCQTFQAIINARMFCMVSCQCII